MLLKPFIYKLWFIIVKKNDTLIEIIKYFLVDFFKLVFFDYFGHYQLLFMINILQGGHDVGEE